MAGAAEKPLLIFIAFAARLEVAPFQNGPS